MLEGAYIPMKDFKDTFYPGKPWTPSLAPGLLKSRPKVDSDGMSMSSASAALSIFTQGNA